jgi:lipoprotein-releasing system permease protein
MRMSYTSLIASRYLHSKRNDGFVSFVTAIGILGVALGTSALIIALSVLGGFEREITEKIIGFSSHVQVLGFQNQPLADYERNTRIIEDSIPLVKSVAPFVSREALIRSRESVDGILLKGLDPLNDISITRKFIVAGKYDISKKEGALSNIVLGKRLAARLNVAVGDKVTVFGIGRLIEQGRYKVMQFNVSGLYESGMTEYDDIYAFTSLADAQNIFQTGDAVTGYDILVTRVDSAQVVADRAQELLGYPHYGRTVFQTYRNIFSWIDLQKKPIPIILGLIIIVATVNIIGTLLMMVLSKTKDIGVLMSMGATRVGIMRIFLRQGLTIAFTGATIGNVFALLVCLAQIKFKFFSLPSDIYFMSTVPVLLRPEYFILVTAISVGLCLLSSVVPARLASRLHPVKALRFA